ncbi:MAG: Dabb family protein [Kiritimatiellae bacterium]|nr:Dabb family protein [Kiritimatiellia bacterium]
MKKANQLKKNLESLQNVIPEIQHIEVGLNTKPSDAACDVVLYSEFNTIDDFQTYQSHPEHQNVVAFVREIVSDRHVVDYET